MDHKKANGQVIIIGANGLVGRRIAGSLTDKKVRWAGTCNKRPEEGLVKLDITDETATGSFFEGYSPDAVFHCANLSGGVDFCESHPKEAFDFHLSATVRIARYCQKVNAMMVFLSTDYVFDGTNGPYREEDDTHPLNLYGRLKLDAEDWIRNNLKRYLIIRTTNVYGWDPETRTPNYMMALYRALEDKKCFNAPSFLQGNPTYAGDLTAAIIELYTKGANGLFHVVGESLVNRYEWAMQACMTFGLDSSLLREVMEPHAGMVSRPLISWLNTDKFTNSYKTDLHSMSDGLKLMKRDMENSVLEKTI